MSQAQSDEWEASIDNAQCAHCGWLFAPMPVTRWWFNHLLMERWVCPTCKKTNDYEIVPEED